MRPEGPWQRLWRPQSNGGRLFKMKARRRLGVAWNLSLYPVPESPAVPVVQCWVESFLQDSRLLPQLATATHLSSLFNSLIQHP